LLYNSTIDYRSRQSKKSELGKKRSELKEIIPVAGTGRCVMEELAILPGSLAGGVRKHAKWQRQNTTLYRA
jgi:hypothetical protein